MKLNNLFTNSVNKSRTSNSIKLLSFKDIERFFATLHKYAWKVISIATGKVRIAPRLRRFNKFLLLVVKVHSNHGPSFTIKWLKACHMSIQRKLSSTPCSSLRDVESNLPLPRLINGLPTFIGPMDRKMIRQHHAPTIRLWLSILSIYRIIDGPLSVKLNTITDGYKGTINDFSFIGKTVSKLLDSGFAKVPKVNLQANELVHSLSAGVNYSVAMSSFITDAIALAKFPEVYNPFIAYCKLTNSSIYKQLNLYIDWAAVQLEGPLGSSWPQVSCKVHTFDDIALGKLSFKPEAAGKLRIFAIADIWTQSLFKPLHDFLFEFLKGLPNDGTFDQDLSYNRSMLKAKNANCAYSVDLSSATDRLPIDLQVVILDKLTGLPIGRFWKDILVLRPYVIRGQPYGIELEHVYYGVGQPMGCLSSWAMLAVTHHFIVQHCALKVYGNKLEGWFENYEVLGDDLVIFDKLVYQEYLGLMGQLNVGVNLSKSLISENLNSFEFAKRTSTNSVDVSGVSWKQLIADDSLLGRANLAIYFAKRGLITDLKILLRIFSRSANENLTTMMSKDNQGSLKASLMNVLGYYSNTGLIPLETAFLFLVDPQDEEYSYLESKDPQIPFTKTMQYLMSLVKGDFKAVIPLSSLEERRDIVMEEILPYIGDAVARDALSLITQLNENYDKYILAFSKTLINPISYSKLTTIEKAQLVSMSEWVILGDRDPEDLFDKVYDFMIKCKELPPRDKAIDLDNEVQTLLSRFKFDPKSKASEPSEIPLTIKLFANAGNPSRKPYHKMI